jgi:hypothetical protein
LEEDKKIIAAGTEEIKKELWEKWQKDYANVSVFPQAVSGLNPAVREKMLSFENTLFYNSLAKNFNLNQHQRDLLPKIVWQLIIKNEYLQIEAILQQNLQIPVEISKQIADSLNQKIFSVLKNIPASEMSAASQASQSKIEKFTLNEALKQVPEVGEQLLTNKKISVKGFPEPVRPSIKNWLGDYFLNLGNEKHDSMQRGNYLFQSPNGKKLSSIERQNLDFILRAFDEKIPLEIDQTAKRIVFPKFENIQPAQKSQNANTEQSNIQKAVFTSPQKMSFEKNRTPNDQNFSPAKSVPADSNFKPIKIENSQKKDDKLVNVINLKDLS